MTPHSNGTVARSVLLAVLAVCYSLLWQGCRTNRVDYADPVLNSRKILLFGPVDEEAAELTIQKLLYLDEKSHEPIDLLLQTPGGEIKAALAIEQTMRLIQSPVNTCALSECNSAGLILLAGGTGKRQIFQRAVVVVHGLTVHGRAPAEYVNKIQELYTEFWRQHAHLPESWLPLPEGVNHVLSAAQAVRYGLADDIVER
jgi:ATP-dependent Clp protease protease subunit